MLHIETNISSAACRAALRRSVAREGSVRTDERTTAWWRQCARLHDVELDVVINSYSRNLDDRIERLAGPRGAVAALSGAAM